jgi:hypothetical protein
MNQELIDMAKQVGIFVGDGPEWDFFKRQYAKFADLVAAAEREACAKVCYELPWKDMGHIPSNLAFAAAIRARGEKK